MNEIKLLVVIVVILLLSERFLDFHFVTKPGNGRVNESRVNESEMHMTIYSIMKLFQDNYLSQ